MKPTEDDLKRLEGKLECFKSLASLIMEDCKFMDFDNEAGFIKMMIDGLTFCQKYRKGIVKD